MFALLIGAQPATAQTGNSSIEVHNRVCPTNYQGTTYFEDCHDTPLDPGYVFTVRNETSGETSSGRTNEEGNVSFANLPADTYTVTGAHLGDAPETFIDCAVGTESTSNREQVPIDDVRGGIQFDLPADTNVVCDWYMIPPGQGPGLTEAADANSSIVVHNRVCPEDYDGGNWFQDCHGNPADPGLFFRFTGGVTREGTTNANGNIGFANLPAGTYTIRGGAPGEFNDYVVSCFTESTNEEIPVDYVTGGVQIDLPPNTNVVCDWYTFPLSPPGTYDLPIYMLLCDDNPGGAASDFVMGGEMPEGCEQYGGATVTITAPDGSPYGTCVTNANEPPCYVSVDIGTTVIASIDPTTLPAGHTVVGDRTREIEIPPRSEAWVLFVAVPALQVSETPNLPRRSLRPCHSRSWDTRWRSMRAPARRANQALSWWGCHPSRPRGSLLTLRQT